jgi:thioredoxin 1
MSKVISVSDSNFKSEVLESEVPVLVEFGAAWCGPCKKQLPILKELASELGSGVKVVTVDIDEAPEESNYYNVKSIPTIMVFKDGEQVQDKFLVGLNNLNTLKALLG